jgi:hypothetical protein
LLSLAAWRRDAEPEEVSAVSLSSLHDGEVQSDRSAIESCHQPWTTPARSQQHEQLLGETKQHKYHTN